MRPNRLTIQGFRAFPTKVEFDLSADVLVLVGPNGQGKTSLLDAILWAISGVVSRIQSEASDVVSLYSETGEATVELELRSCSKTLLIRRSVDDSGQRLFLKESGESFSGKEAHRRLCQLFNDGGESLEASSALSMPSAHMALTRTVYLQQDLVREFVEAEDEICRYENLSKIFGTQRITQLQVELERQKSNWSRATNIRREELANQEAKLRRLNSEIDDLTSMEGERQVDAESWRSWWEKARKLWEDNAEVPDPRSHDAAVLLDRALRRIEALRRQEERRLDRNRSLLERITALPAAQEGGVSSEAAKAALDEAHESLAGAQKELIDAEKALEAKRIALSEAHTKAQAEAVFAKLALQHLGDKCPVCEQLYDRSTAETRLSRIAASADEEVELPDTSILATARAKLAAQQAVVTKAEEELARARAAERLQDSIRSDLEEVDSSIAALAASKWVAELERIIALAESRLKEFRRLQELGETLSLTVTRAGEIGRLQALRAEQATLSQNQSAERQAILKRDQIGETAQAIIEGLRDAGTALITKELKRVSPLAQRIYSAIDPHPALRSINIAASMFGGKGRVTTQVSDTARGVGSEHPERVLSSSQINALALSVFLALNVGSRDLPLNTLILDDPLQSLDDINLLGLIDLLRRLKEHRQIVISTHDARFASLLERKLRPIGEGSSTRVLRFESWSHMGPSITARDVEERPDMYVVA